VHVSEYLHEKQIGSVVAMDFKKKQKVLGGNGTRCSQAVTHPSTDRARRCLTSVIGREPVLFNVVWPLPWCLGVIVGVKYIVFNIPMHEYEHQNAMRFVSVCTYPLTTDVGPN
jgi:hypothetical protein